MSERVLHMLWTPLASSPLLWLAVTLAAYLVGRQVQRLCGGAAFASPVLIAIVLVAGVVLATGTPYATYFAGAQFIHFLLGPATVALAVPLARNLHHVRRNLHGIGLALLAGCADVDRQRGCHRLAARGLPQRGAVDGTEGGDHADRDGGVTADRRRAGVDGVTGHPRRDRGRDDRANRCCRACGSRTGGRTAWPPVSPAAAWPPHRSPPATGWARRSRRSASASTGC